MDWKKHSGMLQVYTERWRRDAKLRLNATLCCSIIWNAAYAMLHFGMAIWHHSFWFASLGMYYISLGMVRFFLIRHTSRCQPGEKMREELEKYRTCGVVCLFLNLSLALMMFFMIYWNRTFRHHEITTIALAAYTFTSFTMAIVNLVKYRKYNSPVYSAAKAIGLAAAAVSMQTLASTMLTTFGEDTLDLTERRMLLGMTGGIISVFIITMAVHMIVQSTKQIKLLDAAKE